MITILYKTTEYCIFYKIWYFGVLLRGLTENTFAVSQKTAKVYLIYRI